MVTGEGLPSAREEESWLSKATTFFIVTLLIGSLLALFVWLVFWADDASRWLTSEEGRAALQEVNVVVMSAMGIWVVVALTVWFLLSLAQKPPNYRIAAEGIPIKLRKKKRRGDFVDSLFLPLTAVWRWVAMRKAQSANRLASGSTQS